MPRYSATVMSHFTAPRNIGQLESPDRVGLAGRPGQGRFVVMQLMVDEERVTAARFQSHGCGATIAAGSMLTELVQGRTIDECRHLSADHLLLALGGLPADKAHCAGFALAALRNALEGDPS